MKEETLITFDWSSISITIPGVLSNISRGCFFTMDWEDFTDNVEFLGMINDITGNDLIIVSDVDHLIKEDCHIIHICLMTGDNYSEWIKTLKKEGKI